MFICINNDFNTKNLYLSSKQKNKITKNDYYYNFIYNDELINMKTIYVNTGICYFTCKRIGKKVEYCKVLYANFE